ncbi:MAG: DUF4214 domain-containing protein [Stenotrophobium sp.]
MGNKRIGAGVLGHALVKLRKLKQRQTHPDVLITCQVNAAYRCLLGREAEPEGLAHWTAFLRGGGDYDKLLQSFVHSAEFQRRLDASAQPVSATVIEPPSVTTASVSPLLRGNATVNDKEELAHSVLGQQIPSGNEEALSKPPPIAADSDAILDPFSKTPVSTITAYKRGQRFGEQFDSQAGMMGASPERDSMAGLRNPLETFFDSHTEGPGLWKWRHYFDIYHRHFAKFIGREVHVLEIGVYSGGGLAMWQSYFGAKCRIYGVDVLEACKSFESESVSVFLGDQADRNFWKLFKAQVPVIDIVIDDGGHQPEQQMVSMEELLPHIRSGGVYLCEDVYGNHHNFHDFVGGMTNQLNELGKARPGLSDFHEGMVLNSFQRDVHSVHLYPYVAVVEKAKAPVSEFTAPRRGTQWLKFGI